LDPSTQFVSFYEDFTSTRVFNKQVNDGHPTLETPDESRIFIGLFFPLAATKLTACIVLHIVIVGAAGRALLALEFFKLNLQG
jgi:hypothetical protein